MRGARALVAAAAIGLSAIGACVAAATTSSPARLRVSPATGTTKATFVVHFTAPVASGMTGGENHGYALSGTAKRHAAGCIDAIGLQPVASTSGEVMAVRLDPAHLGGRWCRTTYSGTVTEEVRPECGPVIAGPQERASDAAIACPQFILNEPIGTFSFRVTAPAH